MYSSRIMSATKSFSHFWQIIAIFFLWLTITISAAETSRKLRISGDPNELLVTINDQANLTFTASGNLSSPAEVTVAGLPPHGLRLAAVEGVGGFSNTSGHLQLFLEAPTNASFALTFDTLDVGIHTLKLQTNDSAIDVGNAFVVLSVQREAAYETVGSVLGWISTVAWDISFLPQIWHNYRRRSVAGLSFDFQTFNFLGFSFYLIFNACFYWSPLIKSQFTVRHPDSVLHVRINDVFFPFYAAIFTAVQIVQCCVYQRAPGQRVSWPCRLVSGGMVVAVAVYAVCVPLVENVLWIDVLYAMSYVKLIISAIKYSPQLYVNYTSKSTVGWNIWQVILDFTGGFCSIVQMFLVAANYDDYLSVLTDPTKLGLGLLSMVFDILFFIQHFILYRGNDSPYQTDHVDTKLVSAVTTRDAEDHAKF